MHEGRVTHKGRVQHNSVMATGWDQEAGDRMRASMDAISMSAQALAAAAGVHRNTIGNMLKGRPADAATVERVAGALGVSVASLMPPASVQAVAYADGYRAAVERMRLVLTEMEATLPPGSRADPAALRASGVAKRESEKSPDGGRAKEGT